MKEPAEELTLVINKIRDKLTELFHYVTEYEMLYNDNPEIQNIIADVNSRFFSDLYWLYWNFITIRVCALMDNKFTGSNENLTVPKLIDVIEKLNLNCLNTIKSKQEIILEKLKPFRKVRNKAFAHFDLETMTSQKTLEVIELDDLIFICNQIEDILNEVNRELNLPETLFGCRSQEGAMRLINFLRLGGERKKQIINQEIPRH
ncbi:hypothetical protein GGR22_002911 [Flavobacterium gossypii]|uniref:HEPN AbiU2-like domain-containing protein n=1 Tax=Flavobacterium gossypii TaxID=1646119 RepID=A0ABR6DTF9_9FLAO|nr:hypothetical protein [Flavobacterium gossypii]MBA9074738.1 hypothetical protein [Flavobacterium gossypii]